MGGKLKRIKIKLRMFDQATYLW